MYNEQIKCEYLEDYFSRTTSKTALADREVFQNKFERLSNEIEIPLNKDLCQLTREEVIHSFGKILPPKRSSANGLLSLARVYSQWCCDNNKLGCESNPFFNVQLKDLDGWQPGSDLLKNEAMLSEILDKVLAPVNMDTVDNLYRPIYYLLFYGFTLSEIVALQIPDLDVEKQCVRHPATNTWVKIPQNVVKLLLYIRRMDSGYMKIRNGYLWSKQLYGDEYLIKRCSQTRVGYEKFLFDKTSKLERLVKKEGYTIRFTVFAIMQSGIFSRIYQREMEDGTLDMSEFVNFRLRDGTVHNSSLVEAYKVGRDEYAGWKKNYQL